MSRQLAAIVLAAGFGRRFGPLPGGAGKLHALLDGAPVLQHSLRALAGLNLSEILVVIAPEDLRAADLARDAGAIPVPNASRAGGLGNSLACGVRGLSKPADGVMVLLGDMPSIKPGTLASLVSAWEALGPDDLLAPTCRGQRGHPVIFGANYWPALGQLEGDQGARDLLADHRARLMTLAVEDDGVLVDVDTPSDLVAAVKAGGHSPA